MSRPTRISNEQILEAARRLFLEHGLTVSTAAIAREAGVSEGSVFRRFPTKDALFQAAMGLPECQLRAELEALALQGDLRSNLVEVGVHIAAYYREALLPWMRLWSHPAYDPVAFREINPDPPPLRTLRRLVAFLQAEMEGGRLRRCDPEAPARMLLGSLHSYVFFELVGLQPPSPDGGRAFVEGLVEALWVGLAPAQASADSPCSR